MNPEDYLVSRLNIYKGKYCFFVGAGVSVCAEIPLASKDLPRLPSIVSCVRRDFYNSLAKPQIGDNELLSWYADQKLLQRPETIYSDALNLIGDTPHSRQHYLRTFFDGKKPGSTHLSIAKLIELNYLDVIFTTNFDSLLEDAIRGNGNCLTPKVASHSDSIADVLLTEPGPKVIKLHGDYLFSDIRNTKEETERLTINMRQKLRSFLREKGLIVIGYSGNDHSIMSIFEQIAYNGESFPYGLYWLHLQDHPLGERVKVLINQAKGHFFALSSAEYTLNELSQRLGGSNERN
jgi:hypothetical protein